jgi:hypothetical protein
MVPLLRSQCAICRARPGTEAAGHDLVTDAVGNRRCVVATLGQNDYKQFAYMAAAGLSSEEQQLPEDTQILMACGAK